MLTGCRFHEICGGLSQAVQDEPPMREIRTLNLRLYDVDLSISLVLLMHDENGVNGAGIAFEPHGTTHELFVGYSAIFVIIKQLKKAHNLIYFELKDLEPLNNLRIIEHL